MERNHRTYTIEPGDLDPEIIACLDALREDRVEVARKEQPGSRRGSASIFHADLASRPRRPRLLLILAWLTGPMSYLLTRAGRRDRIGSAIAIEAVVLAGALVASWTTLGRLAGGGDRSILLQLGCCAAVSVLWCEIWIRGLLVTSRVCRDLELSRPGRRRPFTLGVLGLVLPGFGLLVTGHTRRTALAIHAIGATVVCALAVTQGKSWWDRHDADAAALFTDLQVEQSLLVLACAVLLGLLAWIVQALEGARLAAGQHFVRSINTADRFPAALLAALVVFGLLFSPADAARQFDMLSRTLVEDGFRYIPLWTQRAAAALDQSESIYMLRVAERHEALGRTEQAQEIRQRLAGNWQRYALASSGEETTIPATDPISRETIDPTLVGALVGTLAPRGAVEESPPPHNE